MPCITPNPFASRAEDIAPNPHAGAGGLFIPPWYKPVVPTLPEFATACVIWGFSLGLSTFAGIRASVQTVRQWRRVQKVTLYMVLIWLELLSSTAIGGITYGYLRNTIAPSDGNIPLLTRANVVFIWTFQVHCTLQIIINRISLVALDRSFVRRLKWGVFILVLLVNIAVACIWIPAQLQISQRYVVINDYWDHSEKILLAVVDVALNLYFIYLVRSSLIAYGLVKYVRLYRYNVAMIMISMTMDVLIIAMMSLRNNFFYVFFHPFAYLVKLHIELLMADLIVKIVKASAQTRFCTCGVHEHEKRMFDNGVRLNSVASSHMAPTTGRFNRMKELRQFRARFRSGGNDDNDVNNNDGINADQPEVPLPVAPLPAFHMPEYPYTAEQRAEGFADIAPLDVSTSTMTNAESALAKRVSLSMLGCTRHSVVDEDEIHL